MKRVTDLLTALVFISLTVFISCNKGGGGDDGPTPQEEQVAKLVGTWVLATDGAKLGTTVRPEWEGLTVVISGNADGGTIAVEGIPQDTGASDVWPTSTTWTFGGSISDLDRVDGISMNIQSVTDTQLIVSFTVSSSGRVEGFEGSWTFTFNKSS
ncbi:MAG: hypothetical protein KI791_04480 [Cyclobacteriaceae bacterium]|nr:hypothetical protein [Cyclobacteriaceae bacterium SS2]